MNTIDFLTTILPVSNTTDFYVCGNKTGEKMTQTSVTSVADAALEVQARTKKGENVYVALASYEKGTARKGQHVSGKKCFCLDIDTGPDKAYKTKVQALEAVRHFVQTAGFHKPSFIIDSGRGYHMYWVLVEEISGPQWKITADHLKEFVAHSDLTTDPAVTADNARVMRVVGSVNFKGETPQPCQCIFESKLRWSYDDFKEGFPYHPGDNVVGFPYEDNDRLITQVERPKRSGKLIAKSCGLLQHELDTHGVHADYNRWFGIMNLLAFCDDGQSLIHTVGFDHAGYSQTETQRRFDETKQDILDGKLRGATTCETFHGCAPEVCEKCPHWADSKRGVEWTSPIHFGFVESTEAVDPRTLPYGWVRMPYGIGELITSEGDEAPTLKQRMELKIPLLEVIYIENGILLAFDCEIYGKTIPVIVNATDLSGTGPSLHISLQAQGILLPKEELFYLVRLLVAWHKSVARIKTSKPGIKKFGWMSHGGREGFAVGQDIYWSDGSSEVSYCADDTLKTVYSQTGEEAQWRKHVALALQAEHIETELILATSFASPLVALTGERGCIVSAISAESGTGKSLAMRLAQSVWAHPTSAINAMDDTPNALSKRLSVSNNCPAYWDEVRTHGETTEKFIDFLYRCTLGREKGRMKQDTSLQVVETWETLLCCASNMSIHDLIEAKDRATNAGMFRVLEFQVSKLNTEKMASPYIFTGLDKSFGHIGRRYAQFLVVHKAAATELVNNMIEKVSVKVNAEPSERFLVTTIAVIICGAALAKREGYVNFDVAGIEDFLLNRLLDIRAKLRADNGMVPEVRDSVVLLGEYLDFISPQMIITDFFAPRAGGKPQATIEKLHRIEPILCRVGREDAKICVKQSGFKYWLQENYGNSSQHIKNLVSMGVMAKPSQRLLSGIEGIGLNRPQRCLLIPLNGKTERLFES